MADEQKKLHPDCWKRKRSMSSANSHGSSNTSGPPVQSPVMPMAHTPTRLSHPFSFLTSGAGGFPPPHPSISVANGKFHLRLKIFILHHILFLGLSLLSATVPTLDHNTNR